jgi:hypothetical protein
MSDIKFAPDTSTSTTLQHVQTDLVIKYTDLVFAGVQGCDYREMALAQSKYGCFWNNPFVCNIFEIFDDLFGGLDRTGQTILVGLLGNVLAKRKGTRTPGKHIMAQRRMRDGSCSGLVFTSGQYYLGGDCIFCHTVSEVQLATFKNHGVKSADHDYFAVDYEEFEPVPGRWKPLPNISRGEPDTWWLVVHFAGSDDWKNWFLVNYNKRQLIVGPTGVKCEWPAYHGIDLMETLHFWQPSFLEEDSDDSDDSDDFILVLASISSLSRPSSLADKIIICMSINSLAL